MGRVSGEEEKGRSDGLVIKKGVADGRVNAARIP
jgi:hypothetical protein